jgi:hypothetical protein
MQQFPLSAAESECFQTGGFGNVRNLAVFVSHSNIANLLFELSSVVCLI